MIAPGDLVTPNTNVWAGLPAGHPVLMLWRHRHGPVRDFPQGGNFEESCTVAVGDVCLVVARVPSANNITGTDELCLLVHGTFGWNTVRWFQKV